MKIILSVSLIILVLVVLVGASRIQDLRDRGILSKRADTDGTLTLSIQEKGTFGDLGIRFVRVIRDSRCSEGVVCVSPGDLVVQLRLRGDGVASRDITLKQSEQPYIADEKYMISMQNISPTYPQKLEEDRPREGYEITFKVDEI